MLFIECQCCSKQLKNRKFVCMRIRNGLLSFENWFALHTYQAYNLDRYYDYEFILLKLKSPRVVIL